MHPAGVISTRHAASGPTALPQPWAAHGTTTPLLSLLPPALQHLQAAATFHPCQQPAPLGPGGSTFGWVWCCFFPYAEDLYQVDRPTQPPRRYKNKPAFFLKAALGTQMSAAQRNKPLCCQPRTEQPQQRSTQKTPHKHPINTLQTPRTAQCRPRTPHSPSPPG